MNWLLYLPAIASPIAVLAAYLVLKASGRQLRKAYASSAAPAPRVTPEEVRPASPDPFSHLVDVNAGEVEGAVVAHPIREYISF